MRINKFYLICVFEALVYKSLLNVLGAEAAAATTATPKPAPVVDPLANIPEGM
jgi:hypothetical protein